MGEADPDGASRNGGSNGGGNDGARGDDAAAGSGGGGIGSKRAAGGTAGEDEGEVVGIMGKNEWDNNYSPIDAHTWREGWLWVTGWWLWIAMTVVSGGLFVIYEVGEEGEVEAWGGLALEGRLGGGSAAWGGLALRGRRGRAGAAPGRPTWAWRRQACNSHEARLWNVSVVDVRGDTAC